MEYLDSDIPSKTAMGKAVGADNLQKPLVFKANMSKETSDLPLLVLLSKFHLPAQAWQLKLHMHFLLEHFCMLSSSL